MKIWQAQKTMQDAEQLIESMMHMINEQRYIIERYRLMWGNEVHNQPMEELPDDVDFSLCLEADKCTLVKTDSILPKFKKLKEKFHETI